MRTRTTWLAVIVVSAIAVAATVDAVVGPSSREAPEPSAQPAGSATAPTTAPTTSTVTVVTSPQPRRCRECQLNLRSFTDEPTAVLAQVRGPDCRQPPIRIEVRITSGTGRSGNGTLFGPEPPAFGGLFAAGSTQVAAFRYSPACRAEEPPFNASITAGPYTLAYSLPTVEPCGQTFGDDPGRPCTEAAEAGPWVHSCRGEWVRTFVRAAGFRIMGETGSAWMARGRIRSFYIWATPSPDPRRRPGDFRVVARIRNTVVRTDGLRLEWVVKGARVWVEKGEESPRLGRNLLARLVRASISVVPPGRP